MERTVWTNERLDDLAEAMRSGFYRVDQDIRDLRTELRDTRAELKAEIVELRQWMLRLTIGMTLGFITILAAIITSGA
jgi:hypothetical protein